MSYQLPQSIRHCASNKRGLYARRPTHSVGSIVLRRNFMIVSALQAGLEEFDRYPIESSGINRAAEGFRSNGAYAFSDGGGLAYSEDSIATDVGLVAAVLRKDRKATAEFVDTYTDVVYSFVRRRLNPRQDVVDDLVQDVFIAAWENLGRFRGSSSLRSWLLGIARHKIQGHYRRVLRDAVPLNAELAEILPDLSAGVEAAAERERMERQARKVLGEMPQRYSVVLLWRYWERRSAREMAQATGRSEKAVERLLARAREQFRRRWQNA